MSDSKKSCRPTVRAVLAMLVVPWLLAACAAGVGTPRTTACPPGQCQIDITLPESARGRPEVPADRVKYQVPGNTEIKFRVIGPGVRNGVLLLFEGRSALVNADGDELHAVILKRGMNRLTTNKPGSCPRETCKYSIVNLDCPTCETLDPWIIID